MGHAKLPAYVQMRRLLVASEPQDILPSSSGASDRYQDTQSLHVRATVARCKQLCDARSFRQKCAGGEVRALESLGVLAEREDVESTITSLQRRFRTCHAVCLSKLCQSKTCAALKPLCAGHISAPCAFHPINNEVHDLNRHQSDTVALGSRHKDPSKAR
ncbi:hypothetical protein AC579_2138 [Pseudocercospora musae]|uniref:Uncharacterized protein n=1 Tax=Pseudocercospora musae TaxID=113226 RepID=A0A139I3S5_9PEZI|nr:hypothetical protein AC579_2138 [Pseudocercospora musae]